MTNLYVLVYLCTETMARTKKEDKEELYLNFLIIYYVTNSTLKKYADPVQENVWNIFGWHYLNVFHTVFNRIHIFLHTKICVRTKLNKMYFYDLKMLVVYITIT